MSALILSIGDDLRQVLAHRQNVNRTVSESQEGVTTISPTGDFPEGYRFTDRLSEMELEKMISYTDELVDGVRNEDVDLDIAEHLVFAMLHNYKLMALQR